MTVRLNISEAQIQEIARILSGPDYTSLDDEQACVLMSDRTRVEKDIPVDAKALLEGQLNKGTMAELETLSKDADNAKASAAQNMIQALSNPNMAQIDATQAWCARDVPILVAAQVWSQEEANAFFAAGKTTVSDCDAANPRIPHPCRLAWVTVTREWMAQGQVKGR